jgi:hypothetical protein
MIVSRSALKLQIEASEQRNAKAQRAQRRQDAKVMT